ncbi:Cdc40p [Sugiyamaella lignohabitans]|uniref:Pre-mRNA-processing factor 17 n=1 Tax=Sugiyamaella lignohabitans TaxID=796027 RepID=A0A167D928_9ASCO|nr:Cdc40p [Sugiyamaella lignohabitans]ANB12632.1 Cdc40p [Sugiyamaella lignohabitans]
MALVAYGGDSSDDDENAVHNGPNQPSSLVPKSMNAAPAVHKSSTELSSVIKPSVDNTSLTLHTTNHQLEQLRNEKNVLYQPNQRYDVEQSSRPTKKRRNILTGHAEEQAFNEATFKVQHRTFQNLGYAYDPSIDDNGVSGASLIGDLEKARVNLGRDASMFRPDKAQQKQVRSKRSKGDPSVLDGDDSYKGPWAKFKEESTSSDEYEDEVDEEDEEEDAAAATKTNDKAVEDSETAEAKDTVSPSEPTTATSTSTSETGETTQFHGSTERDYLGRTYMFVPQDLDINLRKEPGQEEWFIPKKKIHTWRGHAGGVTGLRFFPQSGHLLLSAGNDSKIRLWDVYHDRELLRSYSGHAKAVKDIDFSPDGTQFLSCSYDRTIKLWDTETGTCISRFGRGNSVANSIRFNPRPEHSHEFVAAMANKKILQFDIRTQEIVQEYDHHLEAVNTITFVDDNHRFMTTSDDKSIRVWDWGVNVPIKFISDPLQHSMPSVKLHPSGKHVAAQSMDNRILVFGATDRFKANRKKEFTGYNNPGFATEVSFSPDGRYLMSGDSEGFAFFWDWKTTAVRRKLKVHNSLVTCISAHPQETSKVATAGLDSPIHYWD